MTGSTLTVVRGACAAACMTESAAGVVRCGAAVGASLRRLQVLSRGDRYRALLGGGDVCVAPVSHQNPAACVLPWTDLPQCRLPDLAAADYARRQGLIL